jgi:hypothetical protein
MLAVILREGRPAETEDVVGACRKISQWAERNGLAKTAIWYAQAAALVSPMVAEHAYVVGALCTRALSRGTPAASALL